MNFEVNLENLTKEEQEQFNALVEKANKPKNKNWKPIKGDTYYVIDECADICDQIYMDDIDDKKTYSIGNCFKTRVEAKFALERLKVITEMKRYIAEHDSVELDWKTNEYAKFFIKYCDDADIIDIDYNMRTLIVDKTLYASNEKILGNMIKEIGEDRIKKYYFGVE